MVNAFYVIALIGKEKLRGNSLFHIFANITCHIMACSICVNYGIWLRFDGTQAGNALMCGKEIL